MDENFFNLLKYIITNFVKLNHLLQVRKLTTLSAAILSVLNLT